MKSKLLTIFLAFVFPFSAAMAADQDGSSDICDVLSAQDLSPWYPELKGTATPLEVAKGERGAPVAFHTETCMRQGSSMNVGNVVLSVERYPSDADMKQVAEWLKAQDASDETASEITDLKKTTIGSTICETGQYTLTDRDGNIINHYYVACDQLHDRLHVALNLEWPEDGKHLPSTAQTGALLDTVVARIDHMQHEPMASSKTTSASAATTPAAASAL